MINFTKTCSAHISWIIPFFLMGYLYNLMFLFSMLQKCNFSPLSSSFTWLSGMVHSNMLMHFSGRVTDCFDREFRCMYADSQIIDRFYNPDEEGLPGYSYHMPVPNLGLDFLADYGSREQVYSEHSSSQSSDSVSSIKAAPPGMKSINVKVTVDQKNPENSQKPPDRKGVTSPVLQKPSGPHVRRGSPSGSQAVERTSLGSNRWCGMVQTRSDGLPTLKHSWTGIQNPGVWSLQFSKTSITDSTGSNWQQDHLQTSTSLPVHQ